MKAYIFITQEGVTYQPDSALDELDIDNCQVIGFAKGNDENEAFQNLIRENEYLLDTNFDEVICFELENEDYYSKSKYFSLNEYKRVENKLV
ncbi:MAG TPA: hypothetical protein VGB01_06390 [candidate division Zixibacteria bacterium]